MVVYRSINPHVKKETYQFIIEYIEYGHTSKTASTDKFKEEDYDEKESRF